jgi:hypothetical protein
MNPVLMFITYFFKIRLNVILPSTSRLNDWSFVVISLLSFHVRCPAHLSTLISLSEQNLMKYYKLWVSYFCYIISPPGASSILGPNVPLITLILIYSPSSKRDTMFHTHTKWQENYLFSYIQLNFFVSSLTRTVLGPTQPPIQSVSTGSFLKVNRPGCEADHSPPPSAEVKNT